MTALQQPSPPPLRPAVARPDRVREFGALFALGTALSAVYVVSGHRIGLPCPFKLITGWDCPLCGGTRMGAELLHGDVPAAFRYNPLALIGLTAVGVGWVVLVAQRVGILKRRLPSIPPRLRRILTLAAVAVVVAFWVARNLPVGPLAGWRV